MWIKLDNVAPQVEHSLCIFTAALVVRKCAHGKTDRHRAMVVECQGVDGIGQVQPQFFVDVQRPRLGDEPLGQPPPWIRQSRLSLASASLSERRVRLAEAHVIEFRCVDREAGLDVAQAFPVRSAGRRPWTAIARRIQSVRTR